MGKKWFRAKQYGLGWYPCSLYGWIVMIIFILLVVLNFERIDAQSSSIKNTLIWFIPETIVLSIILMIICWMTGEKPCWKWGE